MARQLMSFLLVAAGLQGQSAPVALIVATESAELQRRNDLTRMGMQPGDLLYAGDRVVAGLATRLWFCPLRRELTLVPGSVVELSATTWRVTSGALPAERALPACALPAQKGSRAYGSRLRREAEPGPPLPLASRLANLPEVQRRQMEQDLAAIPLLEALDPGRTASRVVRATLFHRYGLHAEAAVDYRQVAAEWSRVDWPRSIVHEEEDQERQLASKSAARPVVGKTYALVIGISEYPRLHVDEQLRFAHRDAEMFAAYLKSEKGGQLPEEQILLLTNRQATLGAIRTGIATFLRKHAGPADTVVVFFAAHGIVDQRGAYLIAHDSDPEDLETTGLPMSEVQSLLIEESAQIGRVMVYVDVCRAGTLGVIRNNRLNSVLENFLHGTETYGLLASAPGENSIESERFGGGHGAFSYFLLRGLNGDADEDSSRNVVAEELYEYVRSNVRNATRRKQNPRPFGNLAGTTVLVPNTQATGIALADWTPLETFVAATSRGQSSPVRVAVPRALDDESEMEAALAANRILPDEPSGAFWWLERLRSRLAGRPIERIYWENRLYSALLDKGQETILRYLAGDRVPQTRADFEQAGRYYRAALQIDPQAWAVTAYALFCEARVMIFDRRYPEAVELLGRAMRLDPGGAYSYNALGIAVLEQAQYDRAISAFRDASRLAPQWLYPRHNLAQALTQAGRRDEALSVYANAARQAPNEWWLAYSRGLIEQEIGRRREAERSFREAARFAPNRVEPWNALGFLKADAGRRKEAEQFYLRGLALQPRDLPTRHNLALLHSKQPASWPQAIAEWSGILAEKTDYLPSRIAMVELLAKSGQIKQAILEYRSILNQQPAYAAAQRGLADSLMRDKRWREAAEEFRQLWDRFPDDSGLGETLGDAWTAAGEPVLAQEAYQRATQMAEPRDKNRLRRKSRSRLVGDFRLRP